MDSFISKGEPHLTYFKVKVEETQNENLTEREKLIIQNTILHFSAMTNAIVTGVGVMLNPPDEGKLGITFAYPEPIDAQKETDIREQIVKRLNGFFTMSNLSLQASI